MKAGELALIIDLLDKLGYNTETAGAGTVFQRLAQIADYVDTIPADIWNNATRTLTAIPSTIKSIQRGTLSWAQAETGLKSVTISAVNPAKSVLIINSGGLFGDNSNPNFSGGHVTGSIINSTTLDLTSYKGTMNYTNATCTWQVIEFM